MEARSTCHVFLADDPTSKEILTVYCKAPEYSKGEAHVLISEDLEQHHPGRTFELLCMGVIDFADVDQAIIDREDEFFERRRPVWFTRGVYAGLS